MDVKQQLFNLHLFNPDYTVFPQQVFKQRFDEYWFMNLEDWFNNEEDYNCLKVFMQAINEPYLYCSAPDFYHCPDVKIDIHNTSHTQFINAYCLKNTGGANSIGLRVSPTGFWYGQSLDWAIVSDLTNNIYIVGLMHDAALNFKADFAGKYFDIHQLIKREEEANFILGKNNDPDFEYMDMDNKKDIMERYSGSVKNYPLQFFTEYYQFYIRDKNTQASADSEIFWTPQASEDKMAVEEGLLGISVAKYAEIKVLVNVHQQKHNIFSLQNYDHIVESSIDIPSGILQILNCTGMQLQLQIELTPGTYTVRSSSANLTTVQGDEGDDFYVIDIYPSEKKERTVLKKYQPVIS
jgi:hypothetical protein